MKKIIANDSMHSKIVFKDSPCSLLIPKNLIQFYKNRVKRYGSPGAYFGYLIRMYQMQTRGDLQQKSFYDRVSYQPNDASLIKLNFRPENGDWYEFGLLAQRWNISRCYLFVILLKMDWGKLGAVLKKKFGIGLPTVMRYFRKRFYIVKAYFPFKKEPKGIMTVHYNLKI